MPVFLRRKRPYHRVSESLENSLKNIYGQNSRQSLSKIEQRRHSWLTSFLIRSVIFLFLLAVAAWGGFIWWQTNSVSLNQPLGAEIEAPLAIISGAESCFKIRYENLGQTPIASLSVALNLPETFSLTSAKPESTGENNRWTLSPLGIGSDGAIDLCGIFRSITPGSEKIQAVFTYRPANFNSDFQDIVGATMSVDQSVMTIEVNGPTETVVGDQTAYSIKIKNIGILAAENLRLRAILPDSFTTTSADPAVSETGLSYWDIPVLAGGEEKIVSFSGSFTSSANGLMPMAAEIGFLDPKKVFIKQTESKNETKVMGGDLAFNLVINGSLKDQTVDLGGRLRLSLSFDNRGSETMEDISFALELDAAEKNPPIDFELSELSDGAINGSTITWDKDSLPDIELLVPGAAGTIDSVLIIVGEIDENATADSFTATVKATIGKIGDSAMPRTISSTPITVKINSNAELLSEARYFDRDGAPLGSGALPPKVGETTIYRVFWTITNSLHDLKNLSATMVLPADAAWTNNVEADSGSLAFNETTRQVSWSIETMNKNTSSVSAWFDVAITPTEGDLGLFVNLTNPASLEALDSVTNDLIHDAIDALTTAIPNDAFAGGRGIVE